ncbi:MAG TPA: hypothetical protein VGE08_17480 [Steroidobacter sp.]
MINPAAPDELRAQLQLPLNHRHRPRAQLDTAIAAVLGRGAFAAAHAGLGDVEELIRAIVVAHAQRDLFTAA